MHIFMTGTNRGIGLEFTRQYLARGERVFAACRSSGDALQALHAQYGDQLTIIPLEVTDPVQIQAARDIVQHHTSKLDLLINNAGIFRPSDHLADITADALSESFSINTIAPIMMIRQFVDLLERGDNPCIVNITAPVPAINDLNRTQNPIYTASRYALNALTKMIAPELQTSGIITVALWPGYIRTDMNNMAQEAAPPEEALPRAINVIDAIRPEHAGLCLMPDGSIYPPQKDA